MSIDTWAEIKIYVEYILPLAIILLLGLAISFKVLVKKYKIWNMHRVHNIVWSRTSNYWKKGKCSKCNKVILEDDNGLNFGLGIVDYTTTCIKDLNETNN